MKMHSLRRVTRVWLVAQTLAVACAADWPMWRYDAGRTGLSPAGLPEELRLQWRRELGPVAPAWPLEPRMQFDPCYQPVAAGKTLFVGSPNDGSVRAYDTETGEQRWRFYTDGPVRLAPVVWRGSAYVASDDGRVYCLNAQTGAVQWVFRAAPSDRPDLRHLGNNRLVSTWPVRGGPVIVDGVLYVGSGVWPTMGTFVYALDAATGKTVWANKRLHYMTNVRTDHNRIADSALAAQGHIVFAAGKLLVPNGRSMPVGLDPKTGKLLYYVQGYRNGHCRVTARGKYIFVGRNAVLDINTGREVGERWHEGLADTPKEWSPRYDLFETPFWGYKFIPACDAWSVLSPGMAFGMRAGVLYAYNTQAAKKVPYERKKGGHVLHPAKWEAPLAWKLSTKYAPRKWPTQAIIQAGQRLYTHTGKMLLAVDLPSADGQPKLAWEKQLPGAPASMLAADDKLFVVTEGGDILCFGAKSGEPKTHARPDAPIADGRDAASRRAADILAATGAVDGYCVVLGLKDGRLVEEMLRQSRLKVVAVDADKAKVDALRDRLVAARVYGSRADAVVGDPFTLPLPRYLASLAVSERYSGPALAAKMPAARLVEVLRPYGGVACVDMPERQRDGFATWLNAGDLENAKPSYAGHFALLRREGPLPDSAHWTHECASAARTYFSHDRRVKPPLGVLWYGDGKDHGAKKHKDYHVGVKPQVVNGVLVAFNERTMILRAYDVYTGRVLWQAASDPFTRFASMPDGIYAAVSNAVVVRDPYSGKELRRFPYHADSKPDAKLFVADVRVGRDTIVVAAAFEKVRNIAKGLYNSQVLIGLDRRSGKQLWTRQAKDRFNHHGLALGPGLVFVVDSPSADATAEMKRRGIVPKATESTVLALDARSGQVKWRRAFANPFLSYRDTAYPQGSIQSLDDALFYSAVRDVLIVYKDRRYRGVRGATGELLWEQERGASQPIMVQGKIFYNQGGGSFDVLTGKHIPTKARVRGGNGCNHAIANDYCIFRRTFTAAYFEIHTGKAHYVRNARSGCTNSLIPADGVLSSPCFSVGCVCNHPLETSFCLVHMPEVEGWEGGDPVREPLPLGERDPAKWKSAAKGKGKP